jgi:hypothetical protein
MLVLELSKTLRRMRSPFLESRLVEIGHVDPARFRGGFHMYVYGVIVHVDYFRVPRHPRRVLPSASERGSTPPWSTKRRQ